MKYFTIIFRYLVSVLLITLIVFGVLKIRNVHYHDHHHHEVDDDSKETFYQNSPLNTEPEPIENKTTYVKYS